MTVLYYGVKITTTQTTLTDYEMGIVDGVAQWVMGRPGFDGWKEGIIADDSLSPVSQEIEISAGGSYGTMSGFSFAIQNNNGQAQRLKTLGINFVQADIEFWTWRDGVSTVDHTGKIADFSYDEEVYKFEVMDSFRGIHKASLTVPVDTDTFPYAPSGNIGKPIPVCIGYVSKAALISIGGPSGKANLSLFLGVSRTVCAAKGALSNFNKSVPLYTIGVIFGANDAALVGKYLSVVSGGAAQFAEIVSNAATASDVTTVTVQHPIDLSTAYAPWISGTPSTALLWLFEVVQQSFTYIASQKNTFSFETNADSKTALYKYDDSAKEYLDISDGAFSNDLSNINSTGHPGLSIVSKLDSDGNVSAYFPILPKDIQFHSVGISDTWSGPNTFLQSQPNLFDKDQSTYYTLVGNEVDLIIYFPDGGISKTFDDIYILFDITHKITSGSGSNRTIKITVETIDLYGQYSDNTGMPNGQTVFFSDGSMDPVLTTSYSDFFLLPGVYYDTGVDPDQFYSRKGLLSVKAIIDSINKSQAFPAIQLDVVYSISTTDIRVKEISFIGKKNINLAGDTLYAKVKGEIFSDTWGGRKTAVNQVKNIADAAELLIRNYDGRGDTIDTASFDILSDPSTGLRKDWYIGRQFAEEANTADLCNDLARYGFFGLVPKNNGKRAAKAWLDGSVVATHTDANGTILEGSIGARVPTLLANLFNEPQVNYAWNPGSQKYDKFFKITKIDQASFPAFDASPGAAWRTYAVGFADAQYATAAALWTLCHASWTKYGLIQTLPDDMANCPWFPDVEGEWSLTAANNAALLYLTQLCNWTPFRKDVVPYRLPNTAAHAILELLDKIAFNDSVQTGGVTEYGWIVRKAITPGNGSDGKDFIEINLMLAP